MKYFLSWIIIIIMILTSFGCQTQDKQAAPITFSVLYNQSDANPLREDWLILDEYIKRKNVSFDFRLGNDSDYFNDITLAFDTNNIPDIVLKVYPEEVAKYVSEGLLLPVSDYADQMPYFQEYIRSNNLEEEIDNLRLANGKYYLLPGFQREIQVQQWIYRKDLFEKHGLELPKTYDELFAALVTLKEIYPDSTPITAVWGGAHLFAMMGAGYGVTAGWNGDRMYEPKKDQWMFSPSTENYREMLRFLNQSYEAGILDPDLFNQSDDDFYTKLQDGRALVTVTWISSGFDNWNKTLQENGIQRGEWAPMPVLESTVGIKALPAVNRFRKGLAIPTRIATGADLNQLLEFLDWAVYSEEGMTLTTWGVEEITFRQGAEGKEFLPHIQSSNNPEGTVDITHEYGLATLFDLNENEEYEDYKKPDDIVIFLDRSLAKGETTDLPPSLVLDESAIKASKPLEENLNLHASEAMLQFIRGELDIDTDWQTYLGELESLGLRALEAIWNKSWDS